MNEMRIERGVGFLSGVLAGVFGLLGGQAVYYQGIGLAALGCTIIACYGVYSGLFHRYH